MNRFNNATFTLLGLIFLVAALRITHVLPNNFAPITALCLLGSAYFTRRWMAFVFPAAIMLVSDFALGFDSAISTFGVYFSYFLIVIMGFALTNSVKASRVLGITISSSFLFFVVTNFICWMGNPIYSQDFSGLVFNYVGAIPFFRSSFISDIFFSGLFFAAFEFIKIKFPKFAAVPNSKK
jgi:hypothetical protein